MENSKLIVQPHDNSFDKLKESKLTSIVADVSDPVTPTRTKKRKQNDSLFQRVNLACNWFCLGPTTHLSHTVFDGTESQFDCCRRQ